MTSIVVIEKFASSILKYSTLLGHFWHIILFFARFVVLALANSINSDDLREFKCDTGQPGCTQICFNRFAPISHARFFNFQILFLTFPRLFFHLYATREELIIKNREKEYPNRKKEYEEYQKASAPEKIDNNADGSSLIKKRPTKVVNPPKEVPAHKKIKKKNYLVAGAGQQVEIIWTRSISRGYLVHLFIQLMLELVFLFLLNILQQCQHHGRQAFMFTAFIFPEQYICEVGKDAGTPCNQDKEIPCWVPRPTEKSIFMWYMICMALLSMIILFFDIMYTSKNMVSKRMKRNKLKKENSPTPLNNEGKFEKNNEIYSAPRSERFW